MALKRYAPSAPFAVAATIFTLAMAGPMIATLLGVPAQAVWGAFSTVSARDAVRVSLAASAIAVSAAAVLGIPTGYALARTATVTRSIALFVIALPLAFPPVASGIMLVEFVGTRSPIGAVLASHGIVFVDTLWGVALAEFFVAGSFVAIASAGAFASVDPIYASAARTLGAGELRIFFRVALPLAAPNVFAGVLLAWMRALGEYGATSVIAYHPTSLPIALYVALSAQGVRAAVALAYGFIVLAAVVIGVQWAVRRRVV